jgi:hypothetical protein
MKGKTPPPRLDMLDQSRVRSRVDQFGGRTAVLTISRSPRRKKLTSVKSSPTLPATETVADWSGASVAMKRIAGPSTFLTQTKTSWL